MTGVREDRARGVGIWAGISTSEPPSVPMPAARRLTRCLIDGIEPLHPADIADVIGYIVTRERRVAVNEVLVRPGEQTR